MYIAQKWGGFKKYYGRSIIFFSFGLFSQSVGQVLYFLYDIFFIFRQHTLLLGDIGYFGTIPYIFMD